MGLPVALFHDAGFDTGFDAGFDASLDASTCAASRQTFAFSVTTSSLGGRYAPRNIGAIWVETADGAFVRTLAVWARRRLRDLRAFRSRTGTNTIDAVTSATLPTHTTHDLTWNLEDRDGCRIRFGDYRVVLELRDGRSAVHEVPFTYDGTPLDMSPGDSGPFSGMHLVIADL